MKPSDIKLFDILHAEERKLAKEHTRNVKTGDITMEELHHIARIKQDPVLDHITNQLRMWFINEYQTIQNINLTINED